MGNIEEDFEESDKIFLEYIKGRIRIEIFREAYFTKSEPEENNDTKKLEEKINKLYNSLDTNTMQNLTFLNMMCALKKKEITTNTEEILTYGFEKEKKEMKEASIQSLKGYNKLLSKLNRTSENLIKKNIKLSERYYLMAKICFFQNFDLINEFLENKATIFGLGDNNLEKIMEIYKKNKKFGEENPKLKDDRKKVVLSKHDLVDIVKYFPAAIPCEILLPHKRNIETFDQELYDEIMNNINPKIIKKALVGGKNDKQFKYPILREIVIDKENFKSKIKKEHYPIPKDMIRGVEEFTEMRIFDDNNEISEENQERLIISAALDYHKKILNELTEYFIKDGKMTPVSLEKLKALKYILEKQTASSSMTTELSKTGLEQYFIDSKDCLSVNKKYFESGNAILLNKYSNFININMYFPESFVNGEGELVSLKRDFQKKIVGRNIIFESEIEKNSTIYISGVSGSRTMINYLNWKKLLYEGIKSYVNSSQYKDKNINIFFDLNPLGRNINSFFSHEWAAYIADKFGLEEGKEYTYSWEDKKHDGTPIFRLTNPEWNHIKFKRSDNVEGKFFLEGILSEPGKITKEPYLFYDEGYATGIIIPIEELK
jgi:hypothetical protein